MGPAFSRKYNTAITAGTAYSVKIPMIKRGVTDFANAADWTPAAGDVKVSKDGGAAANIATLPAAVAMGNVSYWEFVFSNTELSCGCLVVTVGDSATKAVEDTEFIIETYGNASAFYVADLAAALATPTNITAGVITTVTNLTNAPTAGDLTATMKTSVTTAATAATPIAASVTGAVGSVTGLTASNLDATISSRATPAQVLTTALTEAYAADGAAPTLAQLLFALQAFLQERSVSGTTLTVKKLDGSTTAMTFTLNDGTTPTSITRAT